MNHQIHQFRAARKSGTYFQVPLCAFAFGANDKERLDAIISFGAVQAGKKWWLRATADQRNACLAKWSEEKPATSFKINENRHQCCMRGCEITDVRPGSIHACLERYDTLNTFCEGFIARHGATPEVRLKTGLVFEARDGKGISARELSVLAAIYSIIGNKPGPVLITQKRIRHRALGYKSEAVMQAELPSRTDGGKPLTDWQLRSTLDKLSARKFFVRSTYGNRQTYYSHRMTLADLRKAIIDRKTFMFTNKLLQKLDDKAMTEAIQNQRASLAGQRPTAPDAHPIQERGIPFSCELEDMF